MTGGMIAEMIVEMIVEMIAGIAGTTDATIAGIAEMTGGMTGKSKKAFAMGLGGDRKTHATAGALIPITPAITGRATVTTVKVFVAGTFRATASSITIGDGNRSDA